MPDVPTVTLDSESETEINITTISGVWDKFDIALLPADVGPFTDLINSTDLVKTVTGLSAGSQYNFTITVKLGSSGGTDCGLSGELTTDSAVTSACTCKC